MDTSTSKIFPTSHFEEGWKLTFTTYPSQEPEQYNDYILPEANKNSQLPTSLSLPRKKVIQDESPGVVCDN